MEKEKLTNVHLRNVEIDDGLWNRYIELVDDVIIPFQWELINDNVEDAEKSYCIQNFRVASGEQEGSHMGMVFQDTDVAKWLEAVAFSLAKKDDAELEKLADNVIELISKAQCEDGYLNTYYKITGKPRWSDLLEGHELYTAGHMIEAAVAYFEATGKNNFLNIVCRFADYMYEVFGEDTKKIQGYPGHPEVELALVKLYRVTHEVKYLELANYFVRIRGRKPCYFLEEDCIKNNNYIFPEFKDFDLDYNQSHLPIAEQTTAEGHAVRAVYLYSAMADLAYEYEDEALLRQCDKLWTNIVEKRMYITGSIGSAAYGERFTLDYDLPNNTNYSESCATVGLAMFSNRMFQITKDGKYTDIVEKALYNTLLSGVSMDGKHFFYVNPLEVVPEIADKNPTMSHIETTRQLWFGVACCPPNIARTLASIGNYIYAVESNSIFVNLFISSSIEAELTSGKVKVNMSSNYPVKGDIQITVNPVQEESEFSIAVRKPAFSERSLVKVNGNDLDYTVDKGYIYIKRKWNSEDKIEILLDVSFRLVRCNPKSRDNIGKVSLMKGPWVYCLEEADNGNYLSSIVIDSRADIKEVYDENLLGGTICATLDGKRIDYSKIGEKLYHEEKISYTQDSFKAIPYCYWNNRDEGEMLVWMREE